MNSMVAGGHRSANAANLKGGYQFFNTEMAIMLGQIAQLLSILISKKNVDPNVHVKVFNSIVKVNAKTSKKYIINAFNYMLRDMTLNQCYNYMLKFLDYTFSELTQAFYKRHQKV